MTSDTSLRVSSQLLVRLIVLAIAAWNLIGGLILLGLSHAASQALGAGISDRAGQRLLGAHLLVLAPAYLIIAWRFERLQSLLWLPFATQAVVAFVVLYNVIVGDTDFGDGLLPLAISGSLAGALAFTWVNQSRSDAEKRYQAKLLQPADYIEDSDRDEG